MGTMRSSPTRDRAQSEYKRVYRDAMRGARKRGIQFDLRPEQFADIVQRANHRCQMSGVPFDFSKANGKRRPFAPSLDRIDSEQPYTVENCRLVCVLVNLALNEWGDEPLKIVAAAIYSLHGKNGVFELPPIQIPTLPAEHPADRIKMWMPIDHRTPKGFLRMKGLDCGPGAQQRLRNMAASIAKAERVGEFIVGEPQYQRVDGSWRIEYKASFPVRILDVALEQIAGRTDPRRRS